MPGTERAAQNYPYRPPLEEVIKKTLCTVHGSSVKDHKDIKAKNIPDNIWRDLHALGA